jgi:opacity protein-like surface antigen
MTYRRFIFAAALFAALPAAAQTSPWYLGAAIGQSKADSSLVRDREATIGGGNEPNLQTTSDLRDTSGKIFAGYRLSPIFAVEAHWTSLGKQTIDNTFDVPFGQTGKGAVHTDRKTEGYGVDLLAGWEAAPGLTLFGKVGAFRTDVTTDTTISGDTRFADGSDGTFRSVSGNETIVKYGLGAQVAFSRNLSARLEWERLPDLGKKLESSTTSATGEATYDAIWLAIVYRFQ